MNTSIEDVKVSICKSDLKKDSFKMNTSMDGVEVAISKLDFNNPKEVNDSLKCLAECFTGFIKKGKLRFEPMSRAMGISLQTAMKHLHAYKHNYNQEYCLVAKNKRTGEIVGTIVCEVFGKHLTTPTLVEDLDVYKHYYSLLEELQNRFIKSVKRNNLKGKSLLHIVDIGIKVSGSNCNIFDTLISAIETQAKKDGFEAMFAEATNPLSEKPILNRHGFKVPIGADSNPIHTLYSEHKFFKKIDPKVSEKCSLVYKKISG